MQSDLPEAVWRAAQRRWRAAGAQHVWPIRGRSMWPVLRDGDEVVVDHGSLTFAPGEIVVFWQDGRLLAHRVLYVREGDSLALLTKGDSRRCCDGWVAAENILGRVSARRRRGRCTRLDTPGQRRLGRLIAGLSWRFAGRPPGQVRQVG